jgi:hypothetical protein
MLQNACAQSLENERLWIADVQAYICSHVEIYNNIDRSIWCEVTLVCLCLNCEINRYPNVVQPRISFTYDCIELNVCDHASVPIYEMTNSLNLVNWSFRIQCSAEHLVSICSMSILDCTTFGYLFDSDTQLKNIMLQSTELCYKMHVHRLWKMKDYE